MTIGAAVTYFLLFGSLYFEVFMLLSFIEQRFSRRLALISANQPDILPTVAIVVPCYNEEKTIERTLRSLLALQYPKEKLEIFVVDDGSRDATQSIARSFKYDSRIRVFRKENGGKHTAMNYALKRTQAELIGCLDADSIVEPEALLRIAPIFRNPDIAAVTPGIHVDEPRTVLQHMQHVEYRLSIFNRFILAALGSVFITPGPFSFFRASVVRKLGGWRYAHSTEDMEMALRIQEAGYLIANAPKAIVHTATPETLRGLLRQRVRWTYGWLRNAVDYWYMIGNRRFGNLGLVVLPFALLSIGTGIFFFVRIMWNILNLLTQEFIRIQVTGNLPHANLDPFYINTSVLWFVVWTSVVLILILISAGSAIGTDSRLPPRSTPLFLILYCFIAPMWLFVAVFRALFRTGVRWR